MYSMFNVGKISKVLFVLLMGLCLLLVLFLMCTAVYCFSIWEPEVVQYDHEFQPYDSTEIDSRRLSGVHLCDSIILSKHLRDSLISSQVCVICGERNWYVVSKRKTAFHVFIGDEQTIGYKSFQVSLDNEGITSLFNVERQDFSSPCTISPSAKPSHYFLFDQYPEVALYGNSNMHSPGPRHIPLVPTHGVYELLRLSDTVL